MTVRAGATIAFGPSFRASAISSGRPPIPAWIAETRRFLARARAGIGGVSDNGNMLALPVEASDGSLLLVIAHIGFRPAWRPEPGPLRRAWLGVSFVQRLYARRNSRGSL